ncbi:MAG TPA: hypothetical protein VKP58_16070 [Candidatus Acidoferrum sp.]|nr:hypothetical protein [Candidatus Acidoferrum sp.]
MEAEASSGVGRVWVHPGCFCKSGKQRSYGREKGLVGEICKLNIGNPDGYQKKGVRGEAKRIVIKTKGIAKVAQIWAQRAG